MQCPHCAATVSENEVVCYYCHQLLPPPSEDESPQGAPSARKQKDATTANPPVAVTMPVHRPFRKLLLGLLAATVVLGGSALVALPLGGQITQPTVLLALMGSGAVLPVFLIMLGYSFWASRVMRQLLAGDYLVHWTYREQEWRDFAEHFWKRAKRIDGAICAGPFLVLPTLACVGAPIVNQSTQSGIGLILPAIGAVLVVGLVLFGSDYWLYRQRLQGAGEVLIGRSGILRPEGVVPLAGLARVALEPGEQMLLTFTCRQRIYQDGMLVTYAHTYEVLVPAGREAEAERLVRQF